MKNIRKYVAIACLAMQGSVPVLAQDKTFTVQVDQPIAPINQNMWGIFFEDINMGADGGIYAELIKTDRLSFFVLLWDGKI